MQKQPRVFFPYVNNPLGSGGGEPTIDDEDYVLGAERDSVTFDLGSETGNVDFEVS